MDIKGVYDKKERQETAKKRRKYAQRMKIVGDYEPRFAPRIAEQTLGELFLEQKDVYAFKPKKTAGQVWNEFHNAIEKRAGELTEEFVSAVRQGGEQNVELVYLPVYFHIVKKQYNAEKDYEIIGRWGPYYYSPITQEESTVDFFRNFLGVKGGVISEEKACKAYYRTDEERDEQDLEDLQNKYRVMVCGPTTITAFLNTLRIGFRTVALDKRAAEVWKVLGAAKAQYDKFEGLLDKAKKKITEAGDVLDSAQHRNGMILKKLRHVEEVESLQADSLLALTAAEQSFEDNAE